MRIKYFFLAIITFIIIEDTFSQSTVFVEAGEFGRGILKNRGNECFVVVPNHVADDAFGSINVYGEGSVRTKSNFLQSFLGDLAVLRFTEDVNQNCTAWSVDKDFSEVLKVIIDAKLEIREKTGGLTTIAMNITGMDGQFIYVNPKNFRENIEKGMSGSSLFTEYKGRKVYLGMLQDVEDGEGSVLLADEMEKLMNDFFNPPKTKKTLGGGVSLGLKNVVNDFEFELVEVERQGTVVNLKFDLTSLKQDDVIKMYKSEFKIFDQNGLETRAKSIVVGTSGGYETALVHGITVPMEVQFENVSSSADLISLMQFAFYNSVGEKSNLELRKIDLLGSSSEESRENKNENTAGGLRYKIIHITKSGQSVVCKFEVTSLERDKNVQFYRSWGQMYDDRGLESTVNKYTVGNLSSSSPKYNLIHNINVPLELSFEGVSSSAKKIALLKIKFQVDGLEQTVEFRDVAFSNGATASTITNRSTSSSDGTQGCSEIYFYRMKGFMQCEEPVYITNHGDKMLTMKQGDRYKTIVCAEADIDLASKLDLNGIGLSSDNTYIELGKTYYYKVSCAVGFSKLSLKSNKDGEKDINKRGKYRGDIKTFKLTN